MQSLVIYKALENIFLGNRSREESLTDQIYEVNVKLMTPSKKKEGVNVVDLKSGNIKGN